MPFLVAAGELPTVPYSLGSFAIAKVLRSEIVEISCDTSPNDELENLIRKNVIVQLIGDAAKLHQSGISWLDGLGAWKRPVLLMVNPSSSGEIPGSAAAYTSLCRSFSIPLLGIVQIGGKWLKYQRRLDCLPWCGYIPDEFLNKNFIWKNISIDSSISINKLEEVLIHRINYFNS